VSRVVPAPAEFYLALVLMCRCGSVARKGCARFKTRYPSQSPIATAFVTKTPTEYAVISVICDLRDSNTTRTVVEF
jgi:hypothetical protein